MKTEPQQEHAWLHKLIGEWTFESEWSMGPDQPPMKNTGSEVVNSFGGLWTIGDMEGSTPDGSICKSVMTLGFDPASKRFVGTFIASIMSHLWVYNGALDEAGKVLALDAEGPSFTGSGMTNYQDRIEFINDDHRTLTSFLQGEDGQWTQCMTAHYHRKK